MDNPENLATYVHKTKTSKNTTHYVFDTTIHKNYTERYRCAKFYEKTLPMLNRYANYEFQELFPL
jgi:hypothetical protein